MPALLEAIRIDPMHPFGRFSPSRRVVPEELPHHLLGQPVRLGLPRFQRLEAAKHRLGLVELVGVSDGDLDGQGTRN